MTPAMWASWITASLWGPALEGNLRHSAALPNGHKSTQRGASVPPTNMHSGLGTRAWGLDGHTRLMRASRMNRIPGGMRSGSIINGADGAARRAHPEALMSGAGETGMERACTRRCQSGTGAGEYQVLPRGYTLWCARPGMRRVASVVWARSATSSSNTRSDLELPWSGGRRHECHSTVIGDSETQAIRSL